MFHSWNSHSRFTKKLCQMKWEIIRNPGEIPAIHIRSRDVPADLTCSKWKHRKDGGFSFRCQIYSIDHRSVRPCSRSNSSEKWWFSRKLRHAGDQTWQPWQWKIMGKPRIQGFLPSGSNYLSKVGVAFAFQKISRCGFRHLQPSNQGAAGRAAWPLSPTPTCSFAHPTRASWS